MGTLSAKYIAGFVDADGCIGVQWKKGKYKPLLQLSMSQATQQDEVLSLIQEQNGGYRRVKHIKGRDYTELTLTGATAEKLLSRIKNHLVLKRHYANAALSLIEKEEPPVDLELAKQWLREQRRVPSLPLPNFPPRQWLAGYFDGDGSMWTSYRKTRGGHVQVSAGISCADYDAEGIETIHKAFGGVIKPHSKGNGKVKQWIVSLAPSKAEEFLGYFVRHLVVKRDQADFILACARMGNFRDGKTIHETLKELKARPHRLSEPGADVSKLVAKVERIPSKVWRKNIQPKRQSDNHFSG
ncbi:MAG TPA: LAGLIDADG family homing endonuclease [Alphaproteobacteria bacterium]|nr:LAGLIDADG family homing endonuclease [Alphaproteobacteria bacterium]